MRSGGDGNRPPSDHTPLKKEVAILRLVRLPKARVRQGLVISISVTLGTAALLGVAGPRAAPTIDTQKRDRDHHVDAGAAIFAIHAIELAGFREPDGSYLDYRWTEVISPFAWDIHFGRVTDCSHGLDHLVDNGRRIVLDSSRTNGWRCRDVGTSPITLRVSLQQNNYRVMRPPHFLRSIQDHAQPMEKVEAGFDLSEVQVIRDSWGSVLHASILWTGHAKAGLFQECELIIQDDAGSELESVQFLALLSDNDSQADARWLRRHSANGLPADSLRDEHVHISMLEKLPSGTSYALKCRRLK